MDPVDLLKDGKIVVMPTDTIYGIHASIKFLDSVEKIYEIKQRDKTKPFIVLISDISDLEKFSIILNEDLKKYLNEAWPNPLSVIIPVEGFEFIHRGTNKIAFRMPNKIDLLALIKKTGPLVSTSVNKEGQNPATTIEEARKVFKEQIDFYVDGGELTSKPSKVIEIKDNKITVLRD